MRHLINDDLTVSNPDLPYRMDGFFKVKASVTIEPGVRMEFEEDAAIRVNDGGALLARGVQDDGILMYGVEDTPGFWRGILFRADDLTSELNHVSISHGGREAFAGIEEPANTSVEAGASFMLTNSLIRHSAGWGVWLDHPTEMPF